MAQKERTHRYRVHGSGANLVRVEVLVPAHARERVLAVASGLRAAHRDAREKIEPLIGKAVAQYGVRLTDNIELGRLPDFREKARVVASALEERTDVRGFVLARALRAAAED